MNNWIHSSRLACRLSIAAATLTIVLSTFSDNSARATVLTSANFQTVTITSASDILNDGILIEAISNGIDSGDPADPTVNGVDFISSTFGGGTNANYTNGTYALQTPSTVTALTTASGFGGTLGDLMNATFTVGEGTMTLQNLTPGNTYRLQWLSFFDGQTTATFQFRNESGGAILAGPTARDPASNTILTFQADSATQTLFVDGSASALTLQGFVLHEFVPAPEPSTSLLAVIGTVGLAVFRRRRR